MQELKKENNLTTNSLSIGQILKIPTEEIYENEEKLYTVQKGDTIFMGNNEYKHIE